MSKPTEQEIKAAREAVEYANQQPMWQHADSCPHFLSHETLNCTCNVKTFKYNELIRRG